MTIKFTMEQLLFNSYALFSYVKPEGKALIKIPHEAQKKVMKSMGVGMWLPGESRVVEILDASLYQLLMVKTGLR